MPKPIAKPKKDTSIDLPMELEFSGLESLSEELRTQVLNMRNATAQYVQVVLKESKQYIETSSLRDRDRMLKRVINAEKLLTDLTGGKNARNISQNKFTKYPGKGSVARIT